MGAGLAEVTYPEKWAPLDHMPLNPKVSRGAGAHDDSSPKPKKWVPDWLKERLPSALRPADEVSQKEMSLDGECFPDKSGKPANGFYDQRCGRARLYGLTLTLQL